jgi:peroxiredoxin
VHVFGISRDSPWSHAAWRQSLAVDVPLLSDWDGEATRGFGVETAIWGMADVSRRSAFLIDDGCTVRAAWAYEGAELPDMDAILASARSL